MDSRGTAVRTTAIWQDTINGVNDPMPWPVEMWAENEARDTLWTACTAREKGSDELGMWHERGDIIIHSHSVFGEEKTWLDGGWTILHKPGADPLQEMLDSIPVWTAGRQRAWRSGRVLSPGSERITVPGETEPLRMGWHEALALSAGVLRGMDPSIVRASVLQRCLDLTPKPCVFFLDAEGDDLVIVRWHARLNGVVEARSFSHMRYDAETMQAETVTSSERPSPMEPRRMEDGDMLMEGRAIYDHYLEAAHPEGLGHVRRSGILTTPRQPLLRLEDGRMAPTWGDLMESAALRLVSPAGPTPDDVPPQPPTKTERRRHRERNRAWPSFTVPARAAKPYLYCAKDDNWDKLIVTLPAGTVVDGHDLGGWKIDRFTSEANRRQLAEAKPVEIRLRPGTPVELFRGRGEARESFAIEDPARLADAVAQSPGIRAARRENPEEKHTDRRHTGHAARR